MRTDAIATIAVFLLNSCAGYFAVSNPIQTNNTSDAGQEYAYMTMKISVKNFDRFRFQRVYFGTKASILQYLYIWADYDHPTLGKAQIPLYMYDLANKKSDHYHTQWIFDRLPIEIYSNAHLILNLNSMSVEKNVYEIVMDVLKKTTNSVDGGAAPVQIIPVLGTVVNTIDEVAKSISPYTNPNHTNVDHIEVPNQFPDEMYSEAYIYNYTDNNGKQSKETEDDLEIHRLNSMSLPIVRNKVSKKELRDKPYIVIDYHLSNYIKSKILLPENYTGGCENISRSAGVDINKYFVALSANENQFSKKQYNEERIILEQVRRYRKIRDTIESKNETNLVNANDQSGLDAGIPTSIQVNTDGGTAPSIADGKSGPKLDRLDPNVSSGTFNVDKLAEVFDSYYDFQDRVKDINLNHDPLFLHFYAERHKALSKCARDSFQGVISGNEINRKYTQALDTSSDFDALSHDEVNNILSLLYEAQATQLENDTNYLKNSLTHQKIVLRIGGAEDSLMKRFYEPAIRVLSTATRTESPELKQAAKFLDDNSKSNMLFCEKCRSAALQALFRYTRIVGNSVFRSQSTTSTILGQAASAYIKLGMRLASLETIKSKDLEVKFDKINELKKQLDELRTKISNQQKVLQQIASEGKSYDSLLSELSLSINEAERLVNVEI